jgi:uncharacterized protein
MSRRAIMAADRRQLALARDHHTGMFLDARWENLIVASWRVEPALLEPYVPHGALLDSDCGNTYLSLVGFTFARTRFLGVIPTFPATFAEVNLRFYVKREVDGEMRRGVVFIKEVVPSRIIAATARILYEEPYVRHTMRSSIGEEVRRYSWSAAEEWHSLEAHSAGPWRELTPGSHPHFILEHYWGYNARRDGRTTEYRVEHPPWRFREAASHAISDSVARYFGEPFTSVLRGQPHSVVVAEGSAVNVSWPRTFRSAAEEMTEGRGSAKGNTDEHAVHRT